MAGANDISLVSHIHMWRGSFGDGDSWKCGLLMKNGALCTNSAEWEQRWLQYISALLRTLVKFFTSGNKHWPVHTRTTLLHLWNEHNELWVSLLPPFRLLPQPHWAWPVKATCPVPGLPDVKIGKLKKNVRLGKNSNKVVFGWTQKQGGGLPVHLGDLWVSQLCCGDALPLTSGFISLCSCFLICWKGTVYSVGLAL